MFLVGTHLKWWYGCITSDMNVIALAGLANKSVPTAFPSQTAKLLKEAYESRPAGKSQASDVASSANTLLIKRTV